MCLGMDVKLIDLVVVAWVFGLLVSCLLVQPRRTMRAARGFGERKGGCLWDDLKRGAHQSRMASHLTIQEIVGCKVSRVSLCHGHDLIPKTRETTLQSPKWFAFFNHVVSHDKPASQSYRCLQIGKLEPIHWNECHNQQTIFQEHTMTWIFNWHFRYHNKIECQIVSQQTKQHQNVDSEISQNNFQIGDMRK